MLVYVPPTHQFVIDPRDLGNGYMTTARTANRFTFLLDTSEIKAITKSAEREINIQLIHILASEYQRVLTRAPNRQFDDIKIKWNGVQQNASVEITVIDARPEYTIQEHHLQMLEDIRHNIDLNHMKGAAERIDSANVFEFVKAILTVGNLNADLQNNLSIVHKIGVTPEPIFRMPYGTDMVAYMKRLCNTFHYVEDNSLAYHMKYLLMKELKLHYIVLDEPICIKMLNACEVYCRASPKPRLATQHPSAALNTEVKDA